MTFLPVSANGPVKVVTRQSGGNSNGGGSLPAIMNCACFARFTVVVKVSVEITFLTATSSSDLPPPVLAVPVTNNRLYRPPRPKPPPPGHLAQPKLAGRHCFRHTSFVAIKT